MFQQLFRRYGTVLKGIIGVGVYIQDFLFVLIRHSEAVVENETKCVLRQAFRMTTSHYYWRQFASSIGGSPLKRPIALACIPDARTTALSPYRILILSIA